MLIVMIILSSLLLGSWLLDLTYSPLEWQSGVEYRVIKKYCNKQTFTTRKRRKDPTNPLSLFTSGDASPRVIVWLTVEWLWTWEKRGGKNKKSMAWTEQICKIIYGPAITQIFVQECIVLFFIQVLGGFKLCKKHSKASPRSPFNRYWYVISFSCTALILK